MFIWWSSWSSKKRKSNKGWTVVDKPYERWTYSCLNAKLRVIFLNFTRDWCLLLSDGLMFMFWKHSTFWASWTWSSSDASTCIYRNYRQTPTVIQRCLQKGLEDHGYRPHHVGSCSLRSDGLQAFCTEKVLSSFKQSLTQQAQGKGNRRKARGQAGRPTTDFTCVQCSRDCHSRIEHSSHTRSRLCISITTQSATP